MNKFIFVVISLFVTSISVVAQEGLKKDLSASFKRYDLVKLDSKQLINGAKSKLPIEIQAYGRAFQFVLTANDLRTKNYKAVETIGNRENELEQSEVFTYKGNLTDDTDSEVRFSVREGQIEGLIYTGDKHKFFFNEAGRFSRFAQANETVVYAEEDSLKTLDLSNDTPAPPENIEDKINLGLNIIEGYINDTNAKPETNSLQTTVDLKTVEIATEADYQWVTQAGGATAANNEILSILNLVDGIYKRDLNLTIKVSYQHAWTTADSYSAGSTQALLDGFLAYWNSNYPASQFPRDTAHLFTGKFSNQGIAYQATVCRGTSSAYGLTARSGSITHLLAAHEIGHNLGADHIENSGVCANSLMNPIVGGSVTSFCETSKSQIAIYTTVNGSCLTSGGTPAPTPTPVITPVPTPISTPVCTYSINYTSQVFNSGGGSGSINVTTQSGCAWAAGSNQNFVSLNSGFNGNGSGTLTFSVANNVSTVSRSAAISVAGQLFTIQQSGVVINTTATTRFDFDGDGKADISVFRPSTGTWYITRSSDNSFYAVDFGSAGDVITPADFDGDRKTDTAVFRPQSGTWYYLNSSNGQFSSVQFGQFGDLPVPGDFDGDGRADISVFRPSNGTWYRLNSSNNQFTAVQFGQAGDMPILGDFDGDSKSDIAVFRPSNGTWYISKSSDNSFYGVSFGQSGDIPTVADFDGDKKTDIAVYRGNTGTWYGLNSSDNSFFANQFGVASDEPTVADFDGDGKADASVFRPSTGTWYSQRSTSGFKGLQFGETGDIPTSISQ